MSLLHVAGLIEALGLAPAAVWAGSLGGVILLELLARRPGLVRAAIVHEPALFGVLDDGQQLAKGLVASTAGAVRHHTVPAEFANHARRSVGAAFDEFPPDDRERMFANADVFFDLEVPAVASYRPDPVSAANALHRIDLPITVMGDPANHPAPTFRAARWLADHLHIEFCELPGGHMPYATKPDTTAAAIRGALPH